jgi:hypothetical protein
MVTSPLAYVSDYYHSECCDGTLLIQQVLGSQRLDPSDGGFFLIEA